MLYILNQEEFEKFQQIHLKLAKSKDLSDSCQLADYLAALNSLYLSDWAQVSDRIPRDVISQVDLLHQRSEQRLLRIWQQKDLDFFNRKLAWALLPIDGEGIQGQDSTQLAA